MGGGVITVCGHSLSMSGVALCWAIVICGWRSLLLVLVIHGVVEKVIVNGPHPECSHKDMKVLFQEELPRYVWEDM